MTTTPASILTTEDLDRHVARLATIVWNHGALVEGPHLDEYDDGEPGVVTSMSRAITASARRAPATTLRGAYTVLDALGRPADKCQLPGMD